MGEARSLRKYNIDDSYVDGQVIVSSPAPELNEGAFLPGELMLLLATNISVFDLPNFVIASRWFAHQSEKWWKYFTTRLFNHHPPLALPQITSPNCHDLFFALYKQQPIPLRRQALRIRSGDFVQFIDEYNKGDYPLKFKDFFTDEHFPYPAVGLFGSHFKIQDAPKPEPSLLSLIPLAPEEGKATLLHFIHTLSTPFPRDGDANAIQPNLRFFRTPPSSRTAYNNLYLHLCAHPAKPLIAAIDYYDPELILLLLKHGADINETNTAGQTASDLLIDVFIQRARHLLGLSTVQLLEVSGRERSKLEEKLRSYCVEHFPEMTGKLSQRIKGPHLWRFLPEFTHNYNLNRADGASF